MGGNIGLPILAQDPLPESGVYVLELSSFQIDLTQSLDCDVAMLLNITPDHLDRYDSFDAYAASKGRLFTMQSAGHLGIVSKGPEEGKEATRAQSVAQRSSTNLKIFVPWAYEAEPSERPRLAGPHNAENVGAAHQVCMHLGLSEDEIWQAVATYPGLPHRMEQVREINDVLFVNDSKATNPEAAAPALAAYPRIRWIVGGQAKTEELGDTAKYLDHVVRAYTIGEAGPMFARLLRERGVDVIESETLENAVKCSARDSLPGETVLLSPACASFDQFANFEARGEAFRRLVGDL
jgi:UDP-N-acetylmuramoylalanine--D-glutamate ligase